MAKPDIKLTNNPYTAPSFVYPSDLGEDKPYSIYEIRDSVAIKTGKKYGSIALPFPRECDVGYNAEYASQNLGNERGELPPDDITSMLGMVSATITDPIDSATHVLSNNDNRLQRTMGKITNPHMSMLFKGVNFRQFAFSFTLIARNEKESDLIRDIIYTFKYYMSPSVPTTSDGFSRWMLYPQHFHIGLFTPSDNYLFRMSPCVLTHMEVSYNGSNTPAFFKHTGAPVHHELKLSFTETEIMTKERLEQGY